MMITKETALKVHFWAACGACVTLPFQKLAPAFLLIMFANWLYLALVIRKLEKVRNPFIVFSLAGFYVLHFIGLLYTTNLHAGWFDMQVKSALLIPVMYSTVPRVTTQQFNSLLWLFVSSCSIAVVICLGCSVYRYLELKPWIEHFFTSRFSIFMSPTYFAILLNLQVVGLLYLLNRIGLDGWKKRCAWIFLSLALLGIFLTASKNGIITCVLLSLVFLGYQLFHKHGALRTFIVLLLCTAMVVVSISTSKVNRQRFGNLFQLFTELGVESKTPTGSKSRLISWQTTVDVVKLNLPFGTGTGDIRDELTNEYKKNNNDEEFNKGLNAHSQYLQTAGALGIPGLILLLLSFLLPLKIALKRRVWLLFALVFIVIVASVTESILERQVGVIFYGLMLSLLLNLDLNQPKQIGAK